jgi:hypothetical protein
MPPEVHLHARLVAVGHRVDHAGRLGATAHQGTQRAVELGVHGDEMLAARDRGQAGAGAELDGAGQLQDRVDLA